MRSVTRARAWSWLLSHPVLASFAIALLARAVVATVVTIAKGGTLFLDDATYSQLARIAAAGRLHSLGVETEYLYERTGALLVPVTALYKLLGPIELAGQLYVAVLGAATAAAVARLGLEVAARPWALAAGLGVALLPSQILWSSLILKDACVWAALAALAVVVAIAARTTGRRLIWLALLAAAQLVLLGYLRLPTLEIACVAMVLAMLFSARRQRLVRLSGAVALFVGATLFFHMGVGGVSFVGGSRDPSLQRSLSALGNSRVADPLAVAPPHEGFAAQVVYLPKGLTVIALRPWPWEPSGSSVGMLLARAETTIWYPLVALALVGLTTAWRRRAALAFPVLAGAALLATYGLTEGNLGTAYRHRGEVVWVVILLAALGAERLWSRRVRSRIGASAEPVLDRGPRPLEAAGPPGKRATVS